MNKREAENGLPFNDFNKVNWCCNTVNSGYKKIFKKIFKKLLTSLFRNDTIFKHCRKTASAKNLDK